MINRLFTLLVLAVLILPILSIAHAESLDAEYGATWRKLYEKAWLEDPKVVRELTAQYQKSHPPVLSHPLKDAPQVASKILKSAWDNVFDKSNRGLNIGKKNWKPLAVLFFVGLAADIDSNPAAEASVGISARKSLKDFDVKDPASVGIENKMRTDTSEADLK